MAGQPLGGGDRNRTVYRALQALAVHSEIAGQPVQRYLTAVRK